MGLRTLQQPNITITLPNGQKRGGVYDDRVSWEVEISLSNASFGRVFKSLVFLGGRYDNSLIWDHATTGTIMIRLSPAAADKFMVEAKPIEMTYRSPTWFDNGSLRSLYKRPEDEIEARKKELEKNLIDEHKKQEEELAAYYRSVEKP